MEIHTKFIVYYIISCNKPFYTSNKSVLLTWKWGYYNLFKQLRYITITKKCVVSQFPNKIEKTCLLEDLSWSLNSLNLRFLMFSKLNTYAELYFSAHSLIELTMFSLCSLPFFFVLDKVTAIKIHNAST